MSLAEAVEQAKLELLRASEEEEGVAIRGGVPQDAIPVMADRKLLRWVLKRLLRWAVSKASAQVLIRGIEDDVSPRVELIVESDGVGERAQDEPGKVVEGALDRSFCRLAVEALGGELRGFNGGNICRLVLPAACAHALQPGGAL